MIFLLTVVQFCSLLLHHLTISLLINLKHMNTTYIWFYKLKKKWIYLFFQIFWMMEISYEKKMQAIMFQLIIEIHQTLQRQSSKSGKAQTEPSTRHTPHSNLCLNDLRCNLFVWPGQRGCLINVMPQMKEISDPSAQNSF